MVKFSEGFKQDAVALVRQGASQREVGTVLASRNQRSQRGWPMLADTGCPATKEVTAAEDAQIRELIRRYRLPEQEE